MKNINNIPIKYLSFGLKSKSGINNLGRKTVKTKSSGKSKRKFRILDFYRNYEESFLVLKIEYDPNRSANIALICFKNGLLCYIVATSNLKKGMFIDNKNFVDGTTRALKNYNYGDYISNVELNHNYGSKIARAAGTYCIVLHKLSKNRIVVRLPSGEEKILYSENKGTLGIISNINHKFNNLKKAGRSFLKGKKPIVRGVAKNCVDHPHGGGRGRTSKLPVPSNFTRRVLKGVPNKSKKIKFVYKSRKKKMVNTNLFTFMDKYLSKEKKNYVKHSVFIKVFNRNLIVKDCFKNFNLGVYNGKFFMPIFIDNNKINYMLGIFSFSYSIKLKKKIKIYKKKKKKKK